MSPMKISPPSTALQQRERQLAEQFLAKRQRATVQAPWIGVSRDLPQNTGELNLAKDSIGLVARADLGFGGEVLTNDGGYQKIDPAHLPLGSTTMGVPITQPIEPFPLISSLMNDGSANPGWIDEFIDPPTVTIAPWRAGLGSISNPQYTNDNKRFVYSGGDAGGSPPWVLDAEHGVYSDPPTLITGIGAADIDAGNMILFPTVGITRRNNQALDECRLGFYWLDGVGVQISAVQSDIIGTSVGLISPGDNSGASNWTWRDFTRDFAAPVGARQFRLRLIAIKRDAANSFAQMMFTNFRVDAVLIS